MQLTCGKPYSEETTSVRCEDLHCDKMGKCMGQVEDYLLEILKKEKVEDQKNIPQEQEIQKEE